MFTVKSEKTKSQFARIDESLEKKTLSEDPLYRAYLRLKEFEKKTDKNEVEDLDYAAAFFNTTEKHLRKICKDALQKTERGMSYAVQKAKLDFNNEIYRSLYNQRDF